MMVRWPHMLLAAFLTTGMCVAATGAWYVLRDIHRAEARVMLHWGLGLVAVLIPIQLFFGHLTGLYVLKHQPAKFAAIEARWKTQQPASEVLIAIPDEANERNLFAIEIPKLGSMIASGNWTAQEIGLEAFPQEDRPPVVIPFFGFRIMVGMGLIMLAVSWFGNFLRWRGRLETTRWFLWGTFLAFPDRLRRRPLRLVHRRGRASAVGRVRAAAHQGRGHAVAHDRRRAVLARRLRCSSTPWSIRSACTTSIKLLREGPTDRRARPIPGATRQAADGVRRSAPRRRPAATWQAGG